MGYIYCITSPSGKRYIGQTHRDCEQRFKEHCRLQHSCIILENAIRKYGKENMKLEVLLMIDNTRLDEYESKFIDLYNTLEPHGYNIRTGGSNSTHSDASRQRMREAKLGDKNHNFGKERTPEAKAAISKAKSGPNHHFYNKELTLVHRLELSKAHKITHSYLPMYIVYVKARPSQYQAEGFAVVNHPVLPNKYFTSKKTSIDEKRKQAYEYLGSMNAVQRLNGSGSDVSASGLSYSPIP